MAAFGQYDQGATPQSRDDFELLPEGDYLAMVTESDVSANSKQTGQVLKLTYELIGEGFKGRKVWQRINVQHQSAEAQRIGQIELANLKAACGINGQLADTLMLHNKPIGLKVKIEKADPNSKYKDQNVVFDCFSATGADGAQIAPPPQTSAPAPARAPAPAAAPAAAGTPPWLKKAA